MLVFEMPTSLNQNVRVESVSKKGSPLTKPKHPKTKYVRRGEQEMGAFVFAAGSMGADKKSSFYIFIK